MKIVFDSRVRFCENAPVRRLARAGNEQSVFKIFPVRGLIPQDFKARASLTGETFHPRTARPRLVTIQFRKGERSNGLTITAAGFNNRAALKASGHFLTNSLAAVNHAGDTAKGFDWLSVTPMDSLKTHTLVSKKRVSTPANPFWVCCVRTAELKKQFSTHAARFNPFV